MAHVLGVDEDTGARVVHGKWSYDMQDRHGLMPEGATVKGKPRRYLTDGTAEVVLETEGNLALSVHAFGKGKGIYLSSFEFNWMNARLLLNLIRFAGNEQHNARYITDNVYTECAYYPGSGMLVVINNSDQAQTTTIDTEFGMQTLDIAPFDTIITRIGAQASV